jgi:hypothetical protein
MLELLDLSVIYHFFRLLVFSLMFWLYFDMLAPPLPKIEEKVWWPSWISPQRPDHWSQIIIQVHIGLYSYEKYIWFSVGVLYT